MIPTTPIASEQMYQQALHALSHRKGNSKMLHRMMNRLEAYRQKKSIGWSRPWNKDNLITFQSFMLQQGMDGMFLQHAAQVLDDCNLPKEARDFQHDLLNDSAWMGFLFFSELREDDDLYESATLSLGRRNKENPRQRDRLDIIIDVPLHPEKLQQSARLRVFVDPIQSHHTAPLWQCEKACEGDVCQSLLTLLSNMSWQWQQQPERHWNHWTSTYIDYFGARQYQPQRSVFYVLDGQPLQGL